VDDVQGCARPVIRKGSVRRVLRYNVKWSPRAAQDPTPRSGASVPARAFV